MSKGSPITRADGFYKFLTLIGLLAAVSAAGLTLWQVQRGQERAFALQTDITALTAEAGRLQADERHIQSYLDEMTARVRTATDQGTPHYNFLVDEVAKTTKRVEQAQLAVKARTDVVATKTAQIAALQAQRAQALRLGGIVAGSGIVLTVIGLVLWFWRVQRYVEIETQARMTTYVVEEIVARSRTEALRKGEADPEGVGDVAVVTDIRKADTEPQAKKAS